jgi:hypothetical protein
MSEGRGVKVLLIPDTQVKPGVPICHMRWIGQYAVDKRPDHIVHIGDHHDMQSLSSYDKGKKSFEGRRYDDDIKAGNAATDLLMQPIYDYNKSLKVAKSLPPREWTVAQRRHKEKLFKPKMEVYLGNHEQRIERLVEITRELEGTCSYDNFNWKQHGWKVHDFLQVGDIGGVKFAHYFYNPMNGRPYGGALSTRVKNIGFSFVMGHQQGKQQAEMYRSDGTVVRGLVVGSCYLHDEKYLGPQANHYWRGVVMLHEVRDGNYDLMEVSLKFLRDRYATEEEKQDPLVARL